MADTNSIVNKILGGNKKLSTGRILGSTGKDRMMYSVVLRKKIDIPENKIKTVKKGKRNFLVGEYEANGKTYQAWQITKQVIEIPNKDGTGRLGKGKKCNKKAKADRIFGKNIKSKIFGKGMSLGRKKWK